tara:strand:+ start:1128 stop:1712 length:585 start_codon:yes stop_codon:yes gene_type:complete
MIVGILALQGDYQKHRDICISLGVHSILVRCLDELRSCHALIIPGGESTTISMQIDKAGLRRGVEEFSKNKPIFGTCAGMIILSSNNPEENMNPLNIMDFKVDRNAWGRQIDSFSANVSLNFDQDILFKALFIRAPRIIEISEKIEVLASYNDEPILITNGMHIASSFHPELGVDYRVHKFFIDKINEEISITI